MTSQSPRIYTYKITFEEVPYYYYGIKKEKYFNQEYWGSPITHKWCWEFYTPKKQILEIFNCDDEGYMQAQEIEKRIITPVLNDKWCLNENVGGKMSINIRIQAGKKAGQKTYKFGLGLHSLSIEEKKEVAKKGGKKSYELGVGAFGISVERRKEINKKTNETSKKNRTGLYSIKKDQQIENGKNWGKKGSKKTNSQKWMCLETGYMTTSGPLTKYQRARGIDTSKRVRLS